MPTDGLLPLDKPTGITSAKSMAAARRLLAADKAGHGGTLDPAASGLLPVMLGEATKFAQYFLGADKTYTAQLVFGWHSDTDDGDGTLTRGNTPPQDLTAALEDTLPAFIGDITQRPPAYSAIKHNGRRLYDYARKGEATPDKARTVHIKDITLQNTNGNEAAISVRCGGGTYIRALARDIGDKLACGCYLSSLRRTQVGKVNITNAVTPAALETMPQEERTTTLLPIDAIVADLPATTLADADIADLGGGRTAAATLASGSWRVYSPMGRFAGVAETRDGLLHPSRFLHWTRGAQ